MVQVNITKENCHIGSLLLVSPSCPITGFPCEKDMAPVFGSNSDILLRRWAAEALKNLIEELHADEKIVPVSGYRTEEEQKQIWDSTIQESGIEFAEKYVAVPGHSEHQTGLAIDLAQKKEKIDFICPEFPYTGIFAEFRRRAPYYGFVERYKAGKEAVTGIGAEPWHFRYVGYPHAVIMTEKDMVLEEYIEFLRMNTRFGCPFIYHDKETNIELYYLSVDEGETIEAYMERDMDFTISGTNEGGVIVSRWRR